MRNLALLSGIFGVTGVLLGAFGAHALKGMLLENGAHGTWATAVLYQLVHAVALLAAASWRIRAVPDSAERNWLRWAGLCWSAGILLFSGSLYLLSVGGPRALGPVTPLGGVAFIAGWICLIVHAVTQESSQKS